MAEIIYEKLTLSDKQGLFIFISKINKNFTPSLDSKTDLELFCNKILTLGNVIVAKTDDKIIGIITFYTNNVIDKKAYVSIVGVDPDYSGNHIATRLLIRAIEYSKLQRMEYVSIHTNNIIAKHIYEKQGFEVLSQNNDIPIRYYLEKKI